MTTELGQMLPRHEPGDWVDISESDHDGMKRWRWTCKWCSKTEYTSCMALDFRNAWDGPYERDYCYHCHRGSDGSVQWSLYRDGNHGYYGDGDFSWNGSWKGEKLTRSCYYMGDVGGSWSHDRSSDYGKPIIRLHVSVHAKLAKYGRKGRPHNWSAKLSIAGEWSWFYVDVVTNRRCKSIKQVKEEVDKLDLTDAVADVCRQFYNKDHVDCVWIKEDGEWKPLMSMFADWSNFDWPNPYGYSARDYCSTRLNYGKTHETRRTDITHHTVCSWSSSGGPWDESKYGKKPVPWVIRPSTVLSEDIDVRQSESELFIRNDGSHTQNHL